MRTSIDSHNGRVAYSLWRLTHSHLPTDSLRGDELSSNSLFAAEELDLVAEALDFVRVGREALVEHPLEVLNASREAVHVAAHVHFVVAHAAIIAHLPARPHQDQPATATSGHFSQAGQTFQTRPPSVHKISCAVVGMYTRGWWRRTTPKSARGCCVPNSSRRVASNEQMWKSAGDVSLARRQLQRP
jgi:hypothetical protein